MTKACAVPGCNSTGTLQSFPADPGRALRWLKILGLPNDSRISKLKVCALHFSPKSFTNYIQVQMGFAVRLRLAEDALPKEPEVRTQESKSKVFKDVGCQTQLSTVGAFRLAGPCVNHVHCQTTQVRKQHVSTQANRKPFHRSKALQIRPSHRSVKCDTSALPLNFVTATDTVKRPKYEPCPNEDSIIGLCYGTECTTNADRSESYCGLLESESVELSTSSKEESVGSEIEIVTVKLESREYEEP